MLWFQRSILSLPLVAIAACSTPQEACMSRIDRDLRTVTALIAETETNLARGYTYVVEPSRTRVGVSYCTRSSSRIGFCGSTANDVRRRAVAIDPEAEARKLETLRNQQAKLTALRPQAAAACAAQLQSPPG